MDGRTDGASDGTKDGVSEGLLDIVGRGDADGVTVVEGVFEGAVLGVAVGTIVGDSDARIDGDNEGTGDMDGERDGNALSTIAFGNSTGTSEGIKDAEGDVDGAGESLMSPHVPQVKSLRTLGYSIQVVRHSAVPAVPLYMNHPLVKSTHPSGIVLHSPASSDGNNVNKLPKPLKRLPKLPSSSSSSPATGTGDPTINSNQQNSTSWDMNTLRIMTVSYGTKHCRHVLFCVG